eukprot:653544-Pleurochrysis_carterae.AAC.3
MSVAFKRDQAAEHDESEHADFPYVNDGFSIVTLNVAQARVHELGCTRVQGTCACRICFESMSLRSSKVQEGTAKQKQ